MKLISEEYFVPQNRWGYDITDKTPDDMRQITRYVSRMLVEIDGRVLGTGIHIDPLEMVHYSKDLKVKDAQRSQLIESIMGTIRKEIFKE